MGNEKSKAAGETGDGKSSKQTSGLSTGATVQSPVNIRMVQNMLLIWLDKKIDQDNNKDCRKTITQLRRVVNTINTFTDGDECIEFVETTNKEKACIIISGSLGQHVVSRVHDMSQVDSIFIFCSNKKFHEQWAKEWPKIKGVFTEITPICEALREAASQCEHDAMAISFMATSVDISNKELDQLDCSFMYTQILKEILLSIKFECKHIQEYIDFCRNVFVDNIPESNNIKKFEKDYRDHTPIWWYTCECFVYPMLNRALRTMEVDIIIKMGFFIGDLHRQIEQLHTEQFNGHYSSNTFIVYRGQGLSKADFQQMTQTNGGLMAFNSFLSTSKTRNVSLNFARRALNNPDSVGILFVMTIDPSQSTTSFASITDVGFFGDKEDEVLFSMHAVFRIRDIQPMGENARLFQVNLSLTGDDDPDLRVLTDRMREETFSDAEGWYRLGQLLLKLGQSYKAQQVYQVLLEQATEESEKAPFYGNLGLAKQNQGEYEEAITFYGKSIEIQQKLIPLNHQNLANSYNNIGNVYVEMGEYSKALSYYEKSLAIQQQSLPPNHPDLAISYNNIGNVYQQMGEYSKALSSYEKALAIDQQSLPPNHPDLASSYNNIGNVYDSIGQYSKALSYYEKSLAIQQQSLPPNHPALAGSYGNIGAVYYNMGEYSKALSSHEKALEIRQQSLPLNHPNLASSYNNIGLVWDNMSEYSKALSSYEKALAIKQQSLPPNHPSLASSYNNIGCLYQRMGEYSKALSSHENALAIRQQSRPVNHSDLAMSYNNIGLVYEKMGDYSKARSSYECAVDIGQRSLPPNHPDLQDYRNKLEDIRKEL